MRIYCVKRIVICLKFAITLMGPLKYSSIFILLRITFCIKNNLKGNRRKILYFNFVVQIYNKNLIILAVLTGLKSYVFAKFC